MMFLDDQQTLVSQMEKHYAKQSSKRRFQNPCAQ